MLERYGHGGDLRTAEEAFGRPRERFVDFSSNMNPFGPPPAVERIFREAWREIAHYPDPAVRELRRKIAGAYRIPEESILAGNGAAELIDLAVRVLQPEVMGLARPSFSEYEEAAAKTGGALLDIPLEERYDFALQSEPVQQACREADLLLLGHPNNPTGRLIPPHLLRQMADSGTNLILDEAFIDFCPEEERLSMIREAAHSERLFVIRSMTKFYAIPGIRLGFIVAHPARIERMRRLQVAWSVNFLAQLIGAAVLDEREYAARTRSWLQEERAWLASQLERLGLKVVPSDTNFLLFAFPVGSGVTVKTAQQRLGRRGILIRDASLFTGLDERYARIAIRLRPDNERLIEELQLLLQHAVR